MRYDEPKLKLHDELADGLIVRAFFEFERGQVPDYTDHTFGESAPPISYGCLFRWIFFFGETIFCRIDCLFESNSLFTLIVLKSFPKIDQRIF